MHNEYKVGILNVLTFIISFSGLESTLKIILLIVSIIYTVYKTIEIIEKRKKAKKEEDE